MYSKLTDSPQPLHSPTCGTRIINHGRLKPFHNGQVQTLQITNPDVPILLRAPIEYRSHGEQKRRSPQLVREWLGAFQVGIHT